jgi:SET domain-containing protein
MGLTLRRSYLPFESRPSLIHGIGGFAIRDIAKGECFHFGLVVGFNGFNHSDNPNIYMGGKGSIRPIIALRDIVKDEELTLDYYRKVIP